MINTLLDAVSTEVHSGTRDVKTLRVSAWSPKFLNAQTIHVERAPTPTACCFTVENTDSQTLQTERFLISFNSNNKINQRI